MATMIFTIISQFNDFVCYPERIEYDQECLKFFIQISADIKLMVCVTPLTVRLRRVLIGVLKSQEVSQHYIVVTVKG